ncbi:Transglutaminase-like superfamily protein [Candidatus Tiddalikarchaeum anstoanum]|nr:Transglutaminase-like superfamily protein [Candidatus Tiddalikarchaeum anstoanum]
MKRLLLLLLFIPIVFALDCSDLDPSYIGSSTISYSATGSITFDFQNDRAIVEYVNTDIRAIPQAQVVNPQYSGTIRTDEFGNSMIYYQRTNITRSSVLTNPLEWSYQALVHLNKSLVLANSNPSYPYPADSFPSDVKEYLDFTRVADNSPAIQEKVTELISGVTGYLDVVSKLSKFVAYFLQYNLNYAPSSIPASQVYYQQSGVCDEFSSLLISMLRNAGIPARFVSGFAFTNVGVISCTNFGPHSWVEFYLPGTGWVSIDPTYKEFFFVDAGHVPLYVSSDSSTNIINASYLSSMNISVNIQTPQFNFDLSGYDFTHQVLNLSTRLSNNTLGENDYLLLNASIRNPTNKWALDTLVFETTQELTLLYNNGTIPLVIPPNSAISAYFILLTPGGLEQGFSYVHPMIVRLLSGGYDLFNITINPSLNIATSYNDFINMIGNESRNYVSNLNVYNNAITPTMVTSSDEPVMRFDIKNAGNSVLENVTVNVNYAGVNYNENIGSVLIGEVIHYSKTLELPSRSGLITVTATVSSGTITNSVNSSFTLISPPPFNFNISGSSTYTGVGDYQLSVHTSSIPGNFVSANLKISVNGNAVIDKPFYFSQSVIILPQTAFTQDSNSIIAELTYSDTEGNYYAARSSTNVGKVAAPITNPFEAIGLFFKALLDVFKLLLGL